MLNIVVPLAGQGKSFMQAGYSFPKPLIDVNGKPMIQLVVENLKPKSNHKFIFICLKEHYEKYSLSEIFDTITHGNYECIQLYGNTQGAACTVLTAINFINNDDELLIANADQIVDQSVDKFIQFSRRSKMDGTIMTFLSSHPKWSYVRVDSSGNILEVAEKKVISNNATVGIYYFKAGKDFVRLAQKMIEKDIKTNNEFYICPVFNELVLEGKKAKNFPIDKKDMHGMGTPEDLKQYLSYMENKKHL